ncbi:MAG TPA: hypothetical protein VJQ06_05265 [Rhizomicrobium sp.]|nr:hypothetical protein [Rhizomicrobium sp.]
MPGFSSLSLPRWPEEDAPLVLPPGFHPDGLLGGLNLGAPGADIDSWANGTHSLGSLNLSGGQPKDRAEGIADALDATETTVDTVHGGIDQAFRSFGKSLPGDKTVLHRLPYVTHAITVPLAMGAGIADTFSDINKGAPREEAILGNIARTGLGYGAGLLAGAIPYVGFAAGPYTSYWMNEHLPRGAEMGHSMMRQLRDPQQATALLSMP